MAVVKKTMGSHVRRKRKKNDDPFIFFSFTGDTCNVDCCAFPAWAIALIVIVCICIPVVGLIAVIVVCLLYYIIISRIMCAFIL